MRTDLAVQHEVDFFDLPLGAVSGAARDAIVMVDERQHIVALNEAAARMFGHTQAAVLDHPLSCLIPEARRLMPAVHAQAAEDPGSGERPAPEGASVLALRADGRTFPAEASITEVELLLDGQARIHFVVMLRDLSAERDLRAEVLMLNERLRTVLDLSPAAIWIVDGERVVSAIRATADLFGVPGRTQLVGKSIDALLRLHDAGPLRDRLAPAAGAAAAPAISTGTVLRADGQAREVEVATTALPDHGRTVLQMVMTDVTRHRMQADEQAQHRLELRRLAASVVEAREEERRRIARELHDELGQRLTALKMEISSLRAGNPPCNADGRITSMLQMVDSTVAALRRIAADLRPLMLDDLGLNAAIEWLARDASRRLDLEVTVRLDADDPPLAPGADIALYRMVQEALNNVGRHAHATEAQIGIRQEDGDLVLTVHDNGRGFPERAMRQEGRFGLVGIRERAIMLGGRLDIHNPPAGGGCITVRLPLATNPGRSDGTP